MFTPIYDQFLKSLNFIQHGRLIVILPDGRRYEFVGANPDMAATLQIEQWDVLGNLAKGSDTAFARDYASGKWTTDNLKNLLCIALRNEAALDRYLAGHPIIKILYNLSYWFKQNTLRGSRRNIQAHYDLGNDFYQLWLDPSMTYSSGLFKIGDENLTQAQHNKYDRIIEQIGSSGSTLEIGCGWGGYAERALQRGDFDIKGITLSDQQHMYATERLQGNATIALEDYRLQAGRYDHIVSIEMFEAVGEKYWTTYFNKVASLLKNKGKALVQTITIDESLFENYRTGHDFIRSFIFPGGMLPSSSRFVDEAQKAGLRMNHAFNFGRDYARTLESWLHRFDAQYHEVRKLGYDDGFIRMWRFYLAGCAAAFEVGRTDVYQFELQHA